MKYYFIFYCFWFISMKKYLELNFLQKLFKTWKNYFNFDLFFWNCINERFELYLFCLFLFQSNAVQYTKNMFLLMHMANSYYKGIKRNIFNSGLLIAISSVQSCQCSRFRLDDWKLLKIYNNKNYNVLHLLQG